MRSGLYQTGIFAAIFSAALSAASARGADWYLAAMATTQPATTTSSTKPATTSTAPATSTAPSTSTAPATTTAATKPVLQNASRELSAPEWTVKTFSEAIRLSDADTLEACFNKPPTGDTVTPVAISVVVRALKLKRAAIERFGEDAASQFEVTSMTMSLEAARLAALGGRVRKSGNAAMCRLSDEINLQLTQEAGTGNWKIDPTSYVPLKFESEAAVNKQMLLMNATIQGIDETIAELKEGKQTNVTLAASAYRVRMAALIKKARAAATQPTTQPATGPATTKSAENK